MQTKMLQLCSRLMLLAGFVSAFSAVSLSAADLVAGVRKVKDAMEVRKGESGS